MGLICLLHCCRFWDCEGGENYVLPIKETTLHGSSEEEDLVTTIAYSATSRQLAAGTNMGNVVIWRQSSQKVTDPAQQWEVIAVLHQQSPIMRLTWATKHPLLSVNHDTSVSVLAATDICHHMSKEVLPYPPPPPPSPPPPPPPSPPPFITDIYHSFCSQQPFKSSLKNCWLIV